MPRQKADTPVDHPASRPSTAGLRATRHYWKLGIERLYCLDGAPLLGISVFCALDDEGSASRDGLLAGRLVTYPLVHAVTVGALASAGFEVLATFRRPHFTVRLRTDSDAEATRLLDALGTAQENPYNGEVQRRRGPRLL